MSGYYVRKSGILHALVLPDKWNFTCTSLAGQVEFYMH